MVVEFLAVSGEVTAIILAALGLSRYAIRVKDERERWEAERPFKEDLERERAENDEERKRASEEAALERQRLKAESSLTPEGMLRNRLEQLAARRDYVQLELAGHRLNSRLNAIASCEKELEALAKQEGVLLFELRGLANRVA